MWGASGLGLCEWWGGSTRAVAGMSYDEEGTWERLDPSLVELRERAGLERFTKMGVYEHAKRADAEKDPEGRRVEAKWVWTQNRAAERREARCRVAAQGLGYAELLGKWSPDPKANTRQGSPTICRRAGPGGDAVERTVRLSTRRHEAESLQ